MKRTPPNAGKGRPKGAKNKVTVEMQDIARKLTTGNPRYLSNLSRRAELGKLSPAVEVTLLHYAHGKPPDEVRLGDPDGNALKPHTFIIQKRPTA